MSLLDKECSLCGCKGVHACIGRKLVWTEEEKQRLAIALKEFYEKNE
jgi:hypothetical protein